MTSAAVRVLTGLSFAIMMPLLADAQVSNDLVKIGVLTDLSGPGSSSDETPRIHHTARRRGGDVAAGDTRAAGLQSSGRSTFLGPAASGPQRDFSARSGRARLRQRPQHSDRLAPRR